MCRLRIRVSYTEHHHLKEKNSLLDNQKTLNNLTFYQTAVENARDMTCFNEKGRIAADDFDEVIFVAPLDHRVK